MSVLLLLHTDANSALVDNGGGLIYDTNLNITWYDYTKRIGNPPDYSNHWSTMMTWAQGLNVGGVTGWRLPSTEGAPPVPAVDGTSLTGYNNTTSEMGHLFYIELGNKGMYDVNGNPQSGYGLVNTGPFKNLQPDLYWSSTTLLGQLGYAFNFNFNNGFQRANDEYMADLTMAVHSGDIGPNGPINPVPIPPTIWLLGSGLMGVGFLRKRLRK